MDPTAEHLAWSTKDVSLANAGIQTDVGETYIGVPARLQIPHRRIRIASPSERRKIARHELRSFEIIPITQRLLVAISEA